MSRAELIYPLKERMEKELAKINRDQYNREILIRYYKVRTSQVALATLVADFIRLNRMSQMLNKKFEDATVQDIEDLIFKIDQRTKADNTKNKFRQSLKQFFRWMKGYAPGENPPEVKWIRRKKLPIVTVTREDLISFEDCLKISEHASNIRDKALFQCLLDSGCRIGEILTANIGEVEFNDSGAIIYSEGKTGNEPCILTWSARILAMWLNNHPYRNDRAAPLWPLLGVARQQQLSYAAVRKNFADCVKRTGFEKRVWPHLLRHVSATEDSDKGMPDSYRRYKHHWTPNSRMPQVYEHLSKSVISKIQNETWKRVVGVSKNENTENTKPVELLKKCRRCDYENPRDSMYCNRCGFSLNVIQATGDVILKSKIELLNKLMEDPEKFGKLLKMIK